MANIPQAVLERCPPLENVSLLGRGKVRDLYELPAEPDHLLVVASDRISIFDFVLNALVPIKGQVLNAMNVFWRQLIAPICGHDLVAFGSDIDRFLPDSLCDNVDLQSRATVIKRLRIIPAECIVRGYLTGSGWKSYQADGTVCGHRLPSGLRDGSRLPYALFTPSTKAEIGHDEHVDALTFGSFLADALPQSPPLGREQLLNQSHSQWLAGQLERLSLQLYGCGAQYAFERGLILADTKFELGYDPDKTAVISLGDEALTPDSSRFWDIAAWKQAQKAGKLPPSLDKQYVREEGKRLGIDKLDPANPDHVAQAHAAVIAKDVIAKTSQLYLYIFWRLVGQRLQHFQRERMNSSVQVPERNVDVVLGSRSDLEQAHAGIDDLLHVPEVGEVRVHIVSCHRNPDELRNFALQLVKASKVDVVIAGAGKAAALPGMLTSWLNYWQGHHIPVIGVGFAGGNEAADQAAKLSIEELPNTPVVLDQTGNAFFGGQGMREAVKAAINWEFLPRDTSSKPAEFNI